MSAAGHRDLQAALDERAEDLYEDAPCGYLSTLPDGTIVRVNRTLLEWTGFSREELLSGRRFADLLTAGGRIYHETHYAPLLTMQGSVREIAVEIRCADRRRLPVLVNSVLKRDEEGRPLVIRTTIFDATDRKRYEQELLLARNREREERGRVERLQRLTATLAALRAPAEIAEAIAGELAGIDGVGTAEVALPPRQDGSARVARRSLGGGPPDADLPPRVRLPLEQHGRGLGELVLRAAQPLEPSPADGAFLEACAQQAAQALERAALYEQTAEVAQVLQRSMLDAVPLRDERLRLGACYQPAEESLDVGGDWHDAFPLGRGRVAIVVGDVVGRGIEAATAMGQLRSATRALAGADGATPATVLEGLDRFALHVPLARMATLVYAEVDLDRGEVRLACAGHPPPLLVAPDGAPEVVWGGRSWPIGVGLVPAARTEGSVALPIGGRLLLYTDGLIERRGEQLDRGIERLVEAVAQRAGHPVEALPRELVDALTAGESLRDDVCALCVERVGGAARGAGAPDR